jgi:tetratricopeptide (TPR) repeat protein
MTQDNNWCAKGDKSFDEGRWEEALQFYEKCLELDRKNIKAWINKGESLNFLGRYKEALECCEEALKNDPANDEILATVLAVKGESLNFLGRYKEALECCEEALKKDADNDYALYVKAYALDYFGSHEEAIKYYDKAIKLEPHEADYWIGKGIAFNYLGEYDKALQCAEEAIDIKRDYADALALKGEAYGYQGKYDKALQCAEEAIDVDKKNGYAWFVKAYAVDYFGSHEEAIKYYDKAIKLEPHEADYWIGKGIAFNYLGEYDEAVKCFDKAIQIIPENHFQSRAYALVNKGESLYRLKEYKDSSHLKECERAVDINPTDSHAWTFQGVCLHRLGWYDRALSCFDKVIDKKMNPNFDLAWYLRGYTLDYLGKHEEALRYYNEAIRLNRNDADYWISKGIALYELAEYDEAVKCFEKEAIKLDPTYKDLAYLKKGECEYSKKYSEERYSKALQSYREVSDDSEYYANKYYNMGLCHYQQALFKEAEEEYQKAIDKKPLVEAYYNLGVLYNKINKENDAKIRFEKCLQIDSNFSRANDAINALKNTTQSEWFGWWFTREKIRKAFGLILMFSIVAIVISTTVVTVYVSYINKQGFEEHTVTALIVMLGLLVLILLLPSLRRFKVSEIELETVEIAVVRPELEPALFRKLKYQIVSV